MNVKNLDQHYFVVDFEYSDNKIQIKYKSSLNVSKVLRCRRHVPDMDALTARKPSPRTLQERPTGVLYWFSSSTLRCEGHSLTSAN